MVIKFKHLASMFPGYTGKIRLVYEDRILAVKDYETRELGHFDDEEVVIWDHDIEVLDAPYLAD